MSIEQTKKIQELERQINELRARLEALEGQKMEIESEVIREQITQERIELQTKPFRTRPRGTLTLKQNG